jgi:Peptidase family M28
MPKTGQLCPEISWNIGVACWGLDEDFTVHCNVRHGRRSGGDGRCSKWTAPPTSDPEPPEPATTDAAASNGPSPDRVNAAFIDTVTFLALEGDGRDNLTEGSRTVQDRLVQELESIAQAVPGGDGFLHPFDQGTNVLGFIEGTETPSEVVVLGAHYDHLGHDCPTNIPGDDVCDGAGDSAAVVAAVLEIGRRLAVDRRRGRWCSPSGTPRRTTSWARSLPSSPGCSPSTPSWPTSTGTCRG